LHTSHQYDMDLFTITAPEAHATNCNMQRILQTVHKIIKTQEIDVNTNVQQNITSHYDMR